MESRQGDPEGTYSLSKDTIRRIYRNVIIQSIRDLGIGSDEDKEDVRSWLNRSTFEVVCELAEWNDGWVREIARSVDRLHAQVRKAVTKKSVELLRGASTVYDDDDRLAIEYGGRDFSHYDSSRGVEDRGRAAYFRGEEYGPIISIHSFSPVEPTGMRAMIKNRAKREMQKKASSKKESNEDKREMKRNKFY